LKNSKNASPPTIDELSLLANPLAKFTLKRKKPSES
jgi:hypothetical protein